MSELTVKQIATAYLNCRDAVDARKKSHKEELAPLEKALTRFQAELLRSLDKQGAQNIRIEGVGTVFKKLHTHANVADWDASLGWLVKEQRWDFLERRLNKTAVLGYMEEHQTPPPGVNVLQSYEAHVQREG